MNSGFSEQTRFYIELRLLQQKYSYKVLDNEVTYSDSAVTYLLNDNKLDTLYWFSANKNDKYKITCLD